MNLRTRAPRLGQVLLLAFAFACGVFPLTDTDVWWHLSAGRWMWEYHAVPRADPFCVSSLGRPWVDAQWGFQFLLYPLWKLGGAFALVAAKSLAFAAIFACVYARGWTLRTAPFLFALGAFAAFHARHLADVRPVWVTVLLLACQYRLLRDHLDGRARLPWIGLIVSQLAMAQMQGLYWLGPAQFALLCLGTGAFRSQSLRLLGGGLVLASFANPLVFFHGWRAWSLPLELFARILPGNLFSREVAENIPFWRWWHENPGAAFPFLFMAAAAVLLLAWARARAARGEALLLLLYGGLGVMAQRNLPFFLLGFLIVTARVAPILAARLRGSAFGFRAAAAFALTWSLTSLAGYASDLRASWAWENGRAEKSTAWETPFRFPRGAVDYLRRQPLRGNLFNEMRHGGYIGWHLWPAHHPFIDGRMILHDEAFMREFLDLFEHPARFEAYRRRHGIQIVLLPIGEDDRYLDLAAYLAADKGEGADTAWSVLYCDGAEVLLARPPAWRSGAAPPTWTPGDGEASARARFGRNPRLLKRAEERIAVFLETLALRSAAPGRSPASFLDQVLDAEEATLRRFPALASPDVSLRDSLDEYEKVLRASGFFRLSDSLRAEALARFPFDGLRLRSLDAGNDLGLSLPSRVLREREGSCAGLALLLMTLAERTGVEARPVFLPGHLFIRLRSGPASWRNVELLRGGIAREDSFYARVFQLEGRPWYRPVSREPAQALAALAFNRANAHRAAGRPADALRDYRAAEERLPGFPEALGGEGAMLLSLGDRRAGREKLEKSLAGDPLSLPARENYKRSKGL